MANYGIKVSKPNKSVYSDLPRDFTLNSNFNTLKVFLSGYGTLSSSDGWVQQLDGTWKEIDHNLGYKPMVLFYFMHPELNIWIQAQGKIDVNTTGTAVTNNVSMGYAHLDTNTVALGCQTVPANPLDINGILYKYYILYDPDTGAWYE